MYKCKTSDVQLDCNAHTFKGLFTMANSNLLLSPYKILPIAQENKYLGIIFYHEIVCCVYPLESPHRGDSSEYTQNTIIE